MIATESILQIESLHVQFGRQAVLHDVNLSIPRGQTLAIIGESGCGKTVLLKTVIGLIQPQHGHVTYDGRVIGHLSPKELARQRLRFGFVFQNAALFDSMTVAQNIMFPLRQHRTTSKQQQEQEMLARLAEVGLPTSVLGKHPAELSGGMRKRVGLARALVMQPEVLLYDEPTTGLDPIVSDVINELMIRTRDLYSVTSVIVTHDMKTARKVADRVVMLYPFSLLGTDEPQIIFDGTPAEIEATSDHRVAQFVRGEAGDRLMETRQQQALEEVR